MSTRIGLFGGTFDPIHKGHTHIARAFADELKLDSVIFLPAAFVRLCIDTVIFPV